MKRDAIFDQTGKYRYYLTREWDISLKKAGFILLNPSKADSHIDDPTVLRCIDYAKSWGYGGLIAVNLFAIKATDPNDMKQAKNPVGEDNDAYIVRALSESDFLVAAWGNDGLHINRSHGIIELLSKYKVYGLKITKQGQPQHLGRLSKTLKPFEITYINGKWAEVS